MEFQNRIYLLTSDMQTERKVRSALDKEHHFTLETVCRDIEQLRRELEDNRAGLVLVDVDPGPLEKLADVSPLVDHYAHSRFVILTERLDAPLVLRAMQAGVRHVQVKESLAGELPGVLRDLAPESPLGGARGIVLTVLSASGGSGGTTLAVNAANELQLATKREALIVDLDYDYGAVAGYLELSSAYGISEVLAHRDVIDYHLIRSTAVRYAARLHALLSPASVNGGLKPPLQTDNLEQALRACRQAYAISVIDAPRLPIDAAATLAHASEAVWIVLQPTVKDIRMAKALYAGLASRGVQETRIMPIINRYHKRRQMISLDEMQKALRGIPLALLANDYASAIRGVNYGQPLSDAAPRCALRRDLIKLLAPLAQQSVKQLNKKSPMSADAGTE